VSVHKPAAHLDQRRVEQRQEDVALSIHQTRHTQDAAQLGVAIFGNGEFALAPLPVALVRDSKRPLSRARVAVTTTVKAYSYTVASRISNRASPAATLPESALDCGQLSVRLTNQLLAP
jgi:hypothetical protein